MSEMRNAKKIKFSASFEFALSPRGDLIAAIGHNIVVANTIQMKRLFSCHPLANPSHACFSHDGSQLAVKNTSGKIVIINPNGGETQVDLNNAHEGEGSSVLFSPCDRYLVDGSWAGHIRVRDANNGSIKKDFSYGPGVMITRVSCSQDAQTWAFVHQPISKPGENFAEAPHITLWGWPLSVSEIVRPELDNLHNATLSPDGSHLAIVGYSRSQQKSVLRLLTKTGNVVCSTTVDSTSYNGLRWSPDGTFIGMVQESRIVIYSIPDLQECKSYELEYPTDVCFAPDLSFIALGTIKSGIVKPFED